MMAGTQSMKALIIQPPAAESLRPPWGLWLLLQNLLTSISLCNFFHIHPIITAPLGHCLFKLSSLQTTLNTYCTSIYSKLAKARSRV